MKIQKFMLQIIVIGLAFLLMAGCGRSTTSLSTATPILPTVSPTLPPATPTPAPTDTAMPKATATAMVIPTATPTLTATPIPYQDEDYLALLGSFSDLTAEHFRILFARNAPNDEEMQLLDEQLEELQTLNEELTNFQGHLSPDFEQLHQATLRAISVCMPANETVHEVAKTRHETGGSITNVDFDLLQEAFQGVETCVADMDAVLSLFKAHE